MMRSAALLCHCLLAVALPARGQVDSSLAQSYFKEAAALCERDGGNDWTQTHIRLLCDESPRLVRSILQRLRKPHRSDALVADEVHTYVRFVGD